MSALNPGDLVTIHFMGPNDEEYQHSGIFAYQEDDWFVYVRDGEGYLMPKSRILYVVTTREKVGR